MPGAASGLIDGDLRGQPNLGAVPVDLQVAQDAASLRAVQRLSPPDALIVGTGIASQVAGKAFRGIRAKGDRPIEPVLYFWYEDGHLGP